MLTVTKIVKFDAAHFLPQHEGKCKNMHGHTWKMEIEVARSDGFINAHTGMIFDFGHLKDMLNANLLDKLDHKILNR